MSILSKKKRALPDENAELIDAGLTLAADLIADNAATSLRDGRCADMVGDLAEASRRTQISLHEAVERGLAHGETFESLASAAHVSAEYLQTAYEQFDRAMWAQAGPDQTGREPWRILG